jgi:predicted NUDIX family NTP pyrophosphohydrolase
MKKLGAGLLMYRMRDGVPEVLLVHPGGPYNANKDAGYWSIPKGMADNGEEGDELLEVGKREFREETGFEPAGTFDYLTSVRKSDGKEVHAWMFEGDADVSKLTSNTCMIEWPPRSGKQIEIPEVDRGEFFDIALAKEKISKYQLPFIEEFQRRVS